MQNINDAKQIIEQLNNHGYEGYIVGGFVRDQLLNRFNPNADIDITTNATPEQMMSIFNNYIPTGLKHGTISIKINNEYYETTTYRIDGQYEDNRRPEQVTFVNDIELDLSRRDLTINAMALNPITNEIIDPFYGLQDLNQQLIKAVGNADNRFQEDALRIMRAFRFAAQLNFQIDSSIIDATQNNKNLLQNISIERIVIELKKLMKDAKSTQQFEELLVHGVIKQLPFFKEFTLNRLLQTYKIAHKSNNRFYLWIALLLSELQFKSLNQYFSEEYYNAKLTIHDAQILLKLSSKEINHIDHLVQLINIFLFKEMNINQIKLLIFNHSFDNILLLQQLDLTFNSKRLINHLIETNYQLPIQSHHDIQFSWDDLNDLQQQIKKSKQFYIFNFIQQLLIEKIVTYQLANHKPLIIKFVKKEISKLLKEN